MKIKNLEILFILTLLFHLQWFFGNLYEQVLTPNAIVASIEQINAYNRFFTVTEPYFYYIPLTQIGTLLTIFLAFRLRAESFSGDLRKSAVTTVLATFLTIYIVTQYNLKMFFGDVNHLGERVHELFFQWAVLNAVRILLLGITIIYLLRAYRSFLYKQFNSTLEQK
jgi:hypothetical protein